MGCWKLIRKGVKHFSFQLFFLKSLIHLIHPWGKIHRDLYPFVLWGEKHLGEGSFKLLKNQETKRVIPLFPTYYSSNQIQDLCGGCVTAVLDLSPIECGNPV